MKVISLTFGYQDSCKLSERKKVKILMLYNTLLLLYKNNWKVNQETKIANFQMELWFECYPLYFWEMYAKPAILKLFWIADHFKSELFCRPPYSWSLWKQMYHFAGYFDTSILRCNLAHSIISVWCIVRDHFNVQNVLNTWSGR